MHIVIVGGTGAMGLIFGARLAQQGHGVTLFDVNAEAVTAVNREGAKITDKEGRTDVVRNLYATSDATSIEGVDLAIVFTKCYWTEAALRGVGPCIGPQTTVLSLQNGWGNYDVIKTLVPPEQVLVGVTYVSGTTLGPGHARQVGNPVAYIGRVGQPADAETLLIADALSSAGVNTTVSGDVLKEVFGKLAINVTTLPTSALLGLEAHKLLESEGTVTLMDALLRELVAVAAHQNVALDFNERRAAIHALLKNAVGARGSMLQDVAARRRTEISVINGAVARMGQQAGIPTPVNDTMVQLINAMEDNF